MPTPFHIAFYKGTQLGIHGLYNRLVRFWDNGPYSHCEAVFSDGLSASASFTDGGVRFKRIEFSPERWDVVYVPPALESEVSNWFHVHEGEPYDVLGNLRFLFDFLPDGKNKWFCNEAVGAALSLHEPWRYGPNGLASILRSIYPQPI
jgi:hypothetical protein